jgi:hypothetical protein
MSLDELKASLQDSPVVGPIVGLATTADQVRTAGLARLRWRGRTIDSCVALATRM